MMTFEPGLSRIVAHVSEVEAVFRSTDSVKLALQGAPPLGVRTFVCVLDGEGEPRVFAALYAREIKRCLVYSVEPEAGPGLLDHALSFVEALGFSMEEVDLNFGEAMREVLLKEIPALCPPDQLIALARERRARLGKLERVVAAQAKAEKNPPDENGLSKEERKELKREREKRAREAKYAAGELAAEERAEKQAALLGEAVDRLLSGPNESACGTVDKELSTAPAEGDKGTEELTGEGETNSHHREEQLETDLSGAEKRISALERALGEAEDARDRAVDQYRVVEEEAQAVRKQLDAAEKSLDKSRRETERHESQAGKYERARAKMEERLNELEKELIAAWQEIEEDKDEKKRLNEARVAAEERIVRVEQALGVAEAAKEEADGLLSRVQEKISDLERKLAGSLQELAAVRERADQSIDAEKAARNRIAELESDLEVVRKEGRGAGGELKKQVAENEALKKQIAEFRKVTHEKQDACRETGPPNGYEERVVALEEALKTAREEVEAERFEKELLAREKDSAEKRLHQRQEGALSEPAMADDRGWRERLDEMREELRGAEERTEFLRQELEKMTTAKVAAENRLAKDASLEEKRERGAAEGKPLRLPPITTHGEITPSDRQERRPSRKRSFFHVDWEQDSVAYSSLEEVLEIHQSVGMVQLALEGYPNQYCSAFIVIAGKGADRQVHVVFRLAESNRNLVYMPVQPVEDKAGFERARTEAFKFLEVVGYALEEVALGKNPKSRERALKGVPVLTEVPRKMQI